MKPSKYSLFLIGGVAALGLLPIPLEVWTWISSICAAVVIADVALYWLQRPDISIERIIQSNLAIYRNSVIRLKILNRTQRQLIMKVIDTCPAEFNPAGSNRFTQVNSGYELSYEYNVRPIQRGSFKFDSTTLIVRSILHLWEFNITRPVRSNVNVYPDFVAISGYLELAAKQHRAQLGMKLVARRGSGLEFEQLREYRLGDPLNHLDWKATARHQKLISREFQDERDQMICVLIDTGMTMRMNDGELTSFDHALNAMILLGYVALHQGDSIAVQFFGHTNRWLAPIRGAQSINTLLNSVFDVQSGPEPSDYVVAAESFLTHQRKRSLVMLVTNSREKESEIPSALRLLSKRHLTLFVNLRDSIIDEIPNHKVEKFDDAILLAERSHFLQDRRRLFTHCARSCHLSIDCRPQDLLVRLLNAYWQIKRSGAL
ncbi:MAG: DUF58 domain-containing protein [Gammaproteobacteria bacterium]|nr:DUF58 domain-containing protein [Gammaproteobacteria bacterium]